ncbi:MAG: hypothetical protein K6C05_02380 [Anaerovibrio sp.]|uniref:hypothetical protein n=1 Tax=Anaerovibrio sp. TaxID=1872532 RepID=UPI0025FE2FEF|nr:hypothetical protein [Anaerovibrio sp.]MCR5175676.1 hypothetical protein [Anaerovibrio sp.]
MSKWICSCGFENSNNFCVNCGKPKPDMNQVVPSENTVRMPVVSPQSLQNNSTVETPGNGYQYQQYVPPVDNRGFLDRIGKGPLIALGAVILVVILGVIGYFYGIEDRYINKVQEADNVLAEAHTVLSEINNLDGNPESDNTKNYIHKYEDIQKRFNQVTADLKKIRTGKRYKDYNASLVSGLEMEADILNSVHEMLVNTPDNPAAPGKVTKDFSDKIISLSNMADNAHMDNFAIDQNMKLGNLPKDLDAYLIRYHAVAEQKRIEAERKARSEALLRLDNFRKSLSGQHSSLRSQARANYRSVYYATNVTCYDGKVMIEGEFFNGQRYTWNYVNDFHLDVTLYNQGTVVKKLSSSFGYVNVGIIFSNNTVGHTFYIYDSSVNSKLIFDSFEVEAAF